MRRRLVLANAQESDTIRKKHEWHTSIFRIQPQTSCSRVRSKMVHDRLRGVESKSPSFSNENRDNDVISQAEEDVLCSIAAKTPKEHEIGEKKVRGKIWSFRAKMTFTGIVSLALVVILTRRHRRVFSCKGKCKLQTMFWLVVHLIFLNFLFIIYFCYRHSLNLINTIMTNLAWVQSALHMN